MSKTQLISTSFVAALPGGLLLYLMLMAVLNNLSTMPTMLKVAAISLLVMSIVLVVFPLYLLLFFGRVAPVAVPAAKKPEKSKDTPAAKSGTTSVPAFVPDSQETFSLDDEDGNSGTHTEMFDMTEDEPSDASGDADMFEAGDDEFEFEEFDFDGDDKKR